MVLSGVLIARDRVSYSCSDCIYCTCCVSSSLKIYSKYSSLQRSCLAKRLGNTSHTLSVVPRGINHNMQHD